ncbi:NRDE family protein [uncultured Shewanella sp.]|uniref:NRDE family protein n=1 Tax=uncultured Shewanella sp. TaxID=173975 RepID=UPI0026209E49|nr:NRDE family protein [uncultured Shewanella sp.]
MCILFIALKVLPQYPLIICANRDESHHRPTKKAHFWEPEKKILAGKDLEAGGTWLGINKQGNIAAITNIRIPEQSKQPKKTRGELPILALTQSSPLISPSWLKKNNHQYQAFNLLYGHYQSLHCYNSQTQKDTCLSPGFHAISNGALDEIWPKMAKGNHALEQYLNSHSKPIPSELLMLLTDPQQAEDKYLPHTGISLDWERLLSSIFIKHPKYGTRSSNIILINQQQHVSFTEVRFNKLGQQIEQQEFQLSLEAKQSL